MHNSAGVSRNYKICGSISINWNFVVIAGMKKNKEELRSFAVLSLQLHHYCLSLPPLWGRRTLAQSLPLYQWVDV